MLGRPAQLGHTAASTVLCTAAAAGREGSKAGKGWAGVRGETCSCFVVSAVMPAHGSNSPPSPPPWISRST